VIYDLVDITRDISPFVEGLSYKDCLAEADDLQIELADPNGLWSGPWMPDKNAKLTVWIDALETPPQPSPKGEGAQKSSLPCGWFFIDTVTASGPPNGVSVKGTSADLSTSLRREEKTRAWENVRLKSLFADVAANGGLALSYITDINPTYQRIEQKKQSDLDFAKELAEKEHISVKVTAGQLVVFDRDEYDGAAEIATFPRTDKTRVSSWSLETQIVDAYSACVISYRHPGKKKLLSYTYRPPNAPPAGATLRINKRFENLAQGQRFARSYLELQNRNVTNATVTFVGDTRLVAGVNIRLDSTWGAYTGKYAIVEATHSVWPYRTEASLRRIG